MIVEANGTGWLLFCLIPDQSAKRNTLEANFEPMIYKQVFIAAMFLTLATRSYACGLCRYLTYGPKESKSYIGVFHQLSKYSQYNAQQPLVLPTGQFHVPQARIAHAPSTEVLIDQTDQDYRRYNAVEMRANLSVLEKLNLTLVVPYETNRIYYGGIIYLDGTSTVSDSLLEFSGIGKVLGMIEYIHSWETEAISHKISPSFGLNFSRRADNIPTGATLLTDHTIQTGAYIPKYFAKLGYQIQGDQMGFNAAFVYGWSQENDPEYWFGKSWIGQLSYFHTFQIAENKLVPEMGLTYEHSKSDIEYREPIENTGGSLMHGYLGAGFTVSRFHISSHVHLPIYQELSGFQLESSFRINSQFSLYF